jgi:hypothetical protein
VIIIAMMDNGKFLNNESIFNMLQNGSNMRRIAICADMIFFQLYFLSLQGTALMLYSM